MFKRILAAIDLSDINKVIVDWAFSLAQAFDASLDMVYVQPELETPILEITDLLAKSMADLRRELAEEEMERIRELAEQRGLKNVQTVILQGTEEDQICQYAQQHGDDLILIGFCGEGGCRDLGTIAYRILVRSQIPVLVLPALPRREIQKILVPIDLSPLSERALGVAIQWADRFGAELHVLHIIELHESLAKHETIERIKSQVIDLMNRWVTSRQAISFTPHVERRFSAVPGILDFIQETQPDLVVMASHGRSGVSKWFIGSVSERVLRATDRPVLVVKA